MFKIAADVSASGRSCRRKATGTRTPGCWPGLLRRTVAAGIVAGAAMMPAAWAQIEPLIGQMMLVPYTFCPQGWMEAQGQVLPIAQYTALFSLLGTTYGGNGQTTFGLPDLRGRVPVGVGQGPGLLPMNLGEVGGRESVTLLTQNMPVHSHPLQVSSQAATHATPAPDKVLAAAQNAGTYAEQATNTTLAAATVGTAGGSEPVTVRDPYLGMRWCIAVQGVFPSRP